MTLKRGSLQDHGTVDEQNPPLSFRARAFSVDALLQKQPLENTANLHELKSSESSKESASLSRPQDEVRLTLQDEVMRLKDEGLRVELCSRELWRKFHSLGTEMIITKAGRRMFPTVKTRLHNLDLEASYIVFLDIIPVDDKRYRYVYHSSQWTVAGAGDPPLPRSVYVHPDSPASGQLWMAQGVISFDKLKLTNNRRPVVRGQVSLHSMHKYQPRVHVLRTTDLDTPAEVQVNAALRVAAETPSGASPATLLRTFTFTETAFTTVTAYQNQQITRLKIASNPFAKGFREASKSRDPLDEARSPYPRLPHFSPDLLSSSPFLSPDSNPFTPPLWPPPTPLSLPVKFVIPPSPPVLAPHFLFPAPPTGSFFCPTVPSFRPSTLMQDWPMRLSQPEVPETSPFFCRPPEALDLSTFK